MSEDRTLAIIETGKNGALMPRNFEGVYRLSQIMVASGFMPKGMEKVEAVFVAIQYGLEIGLSPISAVQNIAVVNGRPTIWGDAMIGLVRGSGLLGSMSETFIGEGEATTAVCTVTRKGEEGETVGRFSVTDAKRAGLWGKGGPWTQHPRRMLQMRARGFALRDKFADILKGLYAREELEGEQYMGNAEVVSSADTLRTIQHREKDPESQHETPEPETDSRGVAWDARVHSAGKTRNSDGTWRRRKGVDPVEVAKTEDTQFKPPVEDLVLTETLPLPPDFQDAMVWIESAQDQEALDLAMDAARDLDLTAEERADLANAYDAQQATIERMQQT